LTKPANAFEAARFLQQAQFSSTQAEINQLMANGTTYASWLQQEFNKPLSQTGVAWLDSKNYNSYSYDTRFYVTTYPVDYMLWQQLMSAPDAMRKRFALALSEFFVVSLNSMAFSWQIYGYAHWWDMLCRLSFGTFRELLEEVTLNFTMGNYLNTKGNKGENATGRVPDENYAREVMQLFTIGLYKLNINGTEVIENGQKVDSYTQADITNLARVFTGYNSDNTGSTRTRVTRDDGTIENIISREFTVRRMAFNAADHSAADANFLGASAPASLGGPARMKIALDTLANHPNVGPFFAKQMIQRLVTSNPSPAYVARVASVFNNNGQGQRGDLKAVWTAILLDYEARNPANAASLTHGKLREPMVRFIQWGRSFGFKSAAGSWKLTNLSNTSTQLGQSPLRSPSVFNFFRPGFVPPNTALALGKTPAPEFQIVNETTVAGYLNFMQNTIRNGFSVRRPDLPQNVAADGLTPTATATPLVNDLAASYTDELALVTNPTALVNHLNTVLCAGGLTAGNVKLIAEALANPPVTATSTDTLKLNRIANAVLMVMASTDYLIQK
jgi:uncharacterized protein (DUF1800 family)